MEQRTSTTAGGISMFRVVLVREVRKLLFLSLAPRLGRQGIDSGLVLTCFSGENIDVVSGMEL